MYNSVAIYAASYVATACYSYTTVHSVIMHVDTSLSLCSNNLYRDTIATLYNIAITSDIIKSLYQPKNGLFYL